jgi:hypothetical protein
MPVSMKAHSPSPYPSLLALYTVLVAVGQTNTSYARYSLSELDAHVSSFVAQVGATDSGE